MRETANAGQGAARLRVLHREYRRVGKPLLELLRLGAPHVVGAVRRARAANVVPCCAASGGDTRGHCPLLAALENEIKREAAPEYGASSSGPTRGVRKNCAAKCTSWSRLSRSSGASSTRSTHRDTQRVSSEKSVLAPRVRAQVAQPVASDEGVAVEDAEDSLRHSPRSGRGSSGWPPGRPAHTLVRPRQLRSALRPTSCKQLARCEEAD